MIARRRSRPATAWCTATAGGGWRGRGVRWRSPRWSTTAPAPLVAQRRRDSLGPMPLSIALVLPYGEPSDGFFPDALLAMLGAAAEDAGHRAELVRVYYDGRDPARDAEVAARLERWLDERAAD